MTVFDIFLASWLQLLLVMEGKLAWRQISYLSVADVRKPRECGKMSSVSFWGLALLLYLVCPSWPVAVSLFGLILLMLFTAVCFYWRSREEVWGPCGIRAQIPRGQLKRVMKDDNPARLALPLPLKGSRVPRTASANCLTMYQAPTQWAFLEKGPVAALLGQGPLILLY